MPGLKGTRDWAKSEAEMQTCGTLTDADSVLQRHHAENINKKADFNTRDSVYLR